MIEAIVPADALARGRARPLVGIFPGEGIGPEVVGAALRVLDAVESATGVRLERLMAPSPGQVTEPAMLAAASSFFQQVFERHGAVLSGPLGGRCVYDVRKRFDLFVKLAPICPLPALHGAVRFKTHVLRDVAFVIVRDNAGGVYQGQWSEETGNGDGRVARHTFSYSEAQVRRLARVGVRLAKNAGQPVHVVLKDGGIPSISALWRDVFQQVATEEGVLCVPLNMDLAAYQLLQHPEQFAVVVTPNLAGDMLADAGAVFLGSRGMSYSANFSDDGRAIYQTGHGAAKDLAGADTANPLGQILSLAMLLRESLGLPQVAARIEQAVEDVLRSGWCTRELDMPGGHCVGTRRMGELVAQAVGRGSA
jgi:3-isopropylmalate dehydrogenase